MITLLVARNGENMTKTMIIARKFIVADPWTIAIVAGIPAPLRAAPTAGGTTQAAQTFKIGEIASPLNTLLKVPPDQRLIPAPLGNIKPSVTAPTVKANAIPIDTSFRYSKEKAHQRSKNVSSGFFSIQNPWKHSTCG